MAQQVAKQGVIPEPHSRVVEANDRKSGAFQTDESPLAAFVAGYRITQRPAHPPQQGCLEEEVTNILGLAVQHLVREEVGDVAVVSGERADEFRRVVMPT